MTKNLKSELFGEIFDWYVKKLASKEEFLNRQQEKEFFENYQKVLSEKEKLKKFILNYYVGYSFYDALNKKGNGFYLKNIDAKKIIKRSSKKHVSFFQLYKRDISKVKNIENDIIRFYGFFVIRMARKNEYFMDDIQEGNVGLLTAAKKYDCRKDIRFLTYTSWWILHHINSSINKSNFITIPAELIIIRNKIDKNWDDLIYKYKDKLTREKIAEKLDLDPNHVKRFFNTESMIRNKILSLDASTTQANSLYGNEKSLQEILPDNSKSIEDIIKKREQKILIKKYLNLKNLSEREKSILIKYYLEDQCSLADLGREFNLTRERIRQVKDNALKKIRTYAIMEKKDLEIKIGFTN